MGPRNVADMMLAMPEVTEDEPFAPGIPVFKVAGKVFGILDPGGDGNPGQITLKCDPDWALHLREQYPAVIPGYHTNKRLWNTVVLDGSVPDDEVADMLYHSYEQVIAGMRRAERDRLAAALDRPDRDR